LPTSLLDGLRVLVVDDEKDARSVVLAALQLYGAQVQSAASVTEALEKMGASQPDVLVSDLGMPDADGYTLIQQVRARIDSTHLPAIALTAYASPADRTRVLAAGFQMHMPKPPIPQSWPPPLRASQGRTVHNAGATNGAGVQSSDGTV
jgi:CheY-like chemotaxis protein